MIETITKINISDTEITGIRYLSGNELFVLGHYPHLTMFPGVLSLMLIKLLIQLYCSKNNNGCLFKQISRIQYLGVIEPGDKLFIRARPIKVDGDLITFHGEIIVNENIKVKALIIVDTSYER